MSTRFQQSCVCVLGLTALFSRVAQAGTPTAAQSPGRAVYQKWCAPCHDPGIEHPGTHALMTKYAGGPRAVGVITEWKDLTAEYVRFMVRHGVSVMPHFRKTEISDAELDALAQYLARK
jgi:(+)-pinoresinol hydroxylase